MASDSRSTRVGIDIVWANSYRTGTCRTFAGLGYRLDGEHIPTCEEAHVNFFTRINELTIEIPIDLRVLRGGDSNRVQQRSIRVSQIVGKGACTGLVVRP